MEEFSRTELLIKKEGIETLQSSTVAVFGVGGVGGFVVEALARAGIGTIHIIDHDIVSISNLNRQIIATHQTIDRKKLKSRRNAFYQSILFAMFKHMMISFYLKQ